MFTAAAASLLVLERQSSEAGSIRFHMKGEKAFAKSTTELFATQLSRIFSNPVKSPLQSIVCINDIHLRLQIRLRTRFSPQCQTQRTSSPAHKTGKTGCPGLAR
jgi:hypothetical protein